MPCPLLTLPLELRQQVFSSIVESPHTINVSLPTISDCQNPIEQPSRTCKQLYKEIRVWSSFASNSSFIHIPPFTFITPSTTIKFHLKHGKASINLSKTPQSLSEAAIFKLWRDIMLKLNTSEMDAIDREIRDQFDKGDKRILCVMEGIYEDIVDPVWAEDVSVYGGNRYAVLTTGFWGRKFCKWEGTADCGL